MKCPKCGQPDSHVIDSRQSGEGSSIRRRRACSACGKRFTTYEVVETAPLVVIKKDGSREFFDKHKLQTGILHACQKRQVDVSAIVDGIEKDLQNLLEEEVSSERIGQMVMDRLREADAVSYVRFASVYREFKDVDTFLDEINNMIRRDKKASGGKKR